MLADRITEQQVAAQKAREAARPIGNQRAQELAALLRTNTNVQRSLQMIRSAEGTQKYAEPERVNFGNSRRADDLAQHGNVMRPFKNPAGGPNRTSATGAYQFLGSTWASTQKRLGLPDFSRQSQDIAALYQIQQAGGLEAAKSGNVPELARRVGPVWSSLGHNDHMQPTRSLNYLQTAFNAPIADGGTQVNYAPDRNAGAAGSAGSTTVAGRNSGAIGKQPSGMRTNGGASDPLSTDIIDSSGVGVGSDLSPLSASLTPIQQLMFEQAQALQRTQDLMRPTTQLSQATPLSTPILFGG